MKIRAIKLYETGSPENMKWEEIELGEISNDEVLIKHTAVGFNLIDTYHRGGIYPTPKKPCGLGTEASGIVEKVGKNITNFAIGDRVAYAGSGAGLGAYCYKRIMNTSGLIKIPDWMGDKTAAAILTKGRTVEYLFNRTYSLKEGDNILFHAAAGGVGLIAGQWAKAIGVNAIGIVGSESKIQIAKDSGYSHVFAMDDEDIKTKIMDLTKGVGVDVVYDSVGKTTWDLSLSCVKKLGLVVSFGSASGNPPTYDVAVDGVKNSAYIHRATMVNYMTTPEISLASAMKVFEMIKEGSIALQINDSYALDDVVKVHEDAEARLTTGQIVMTV
ncbi:quinone oxidoreductase [Hyphomicrobiales bacterium]|nr:quinone oxidoreductase [Hyphomicrobiales bacterium]MDC0139720.1 quinone oxidoreductase [Hyphomicrobiales bacterium]